MFRDRTACRLEGEHSGSRGDRFLTPFPPSQLGIVLLILVCPLIKAAIGVPPRGGGEDGEEEEEEDTAGDKED